MICSHKRKGAERCKCFWKDDLSPVIDRIFAADALIIGSPIYLGNITSQVRGLIERLHFCALSYDDYSNYFTRKVDVGIILTMNAPKAFYHLIARRPLPQFTNLTLDRSELRSLRVNREGMNCLRMYLPYL